MPVKSPDLHGSAPDESTVVLLIIDLISDFDFEDGEALLEEAMKIAPPVRQLKERARAAGIPTLYVNDNYGRWQSDLEKLVEHAIRPGSRGRELVEMLIPEDDDYFVLKPKHSAFYSTTLDTLLKYLGARTLILTGAAANMCVLFTASDAHMRDFTIVVPEDCVASVEAEDTRQALQLMRRVLAVDTTCAADLDFDALKGDGETKEGDAG